MQQHETVEQYLKRGGTITQFSPAPNGNAESTGLYDNHTAAQATDEIIGTVSWRDLYESADPELDDPKYWKKLNKKLDQILKKNKG